MRARAGAAAGSAESGAADGPALRRLWVFLGGLAALRIAYLVAGGLDLSPDEAHYWEWSRRLDLAYYSKGPLVAYLIRVLTATLGTSPVAIRLGAVLLSLVGSLGIYRLGRLAFGDPRAGLVAVVGLQLTPLFWAGSLLMTIDPPFVVFWILTLLGLYRALARDEPSGWLWAGLAVGLGTLAKYTMLFVLPGLALYLWRAPAARASLRRAALGGGAAVAAVLVLPVLAWNARHGWVTARHVASQGRGPGLGALFPVEFVGGQLLVLTPLVAAILGWALWYGVREGLVRGREPYRFLAAFATPVVGFYLLLSLQGKVQANWPAAAYPPLALLAAGALAEREVGLASAARRRQRGLLVAAATLALAVSAIGHAPGLLGVPPHLDPTSRLRGWQDLGAAVGVAWRGMPAPERTFLVAERYQVTSELAFYVPGRPPAYNVNLGRRLNQYDFWEGPESRLGWDAIYVRDGVGELDERIARAFARIDGPAVVEVRRRGLILHTFVLYRGYGFRGFEAPAGPSTY